jgi:hypothetical protein
VTNEERAASHSGVFPQRQQCLAATERTTPGHPEAAVYS